MRLPTAVGLVRVGEDEPVVRVSFLAGSRRRSLGGRGLIAAVAACVALAGPAGSAYAAPDPGPLPTGTDVDYQLGGARPVPGHVGIVVRDRNARPAAGRYDVCYVNGFQTQPDERRFWRHHPHLLLRQGGRPVEDEAWGEWLLDPRTRAKRAALARIVGRWVAGCAADGFDAVELDNLDSFTRSHGLVSRRQALAYARLLVAAGHRAGLAVGQKNLAAYDGTRIGYDFAVARSAVATASAARTCGTTATRCSRSSTAPATSGGPAPTSATGCRSCSATAR